MSPGAPWVRQSPDILVPEGDTLTLSCCWTLEARRFLVTWLKNGSVLKVLQKVNPFGSLETSDCLNLTLTEVSQEASGSYTCRVLTELPAYSSLEGGVTTVTVEDDRRTPPAGELLPQVFLPRPSRTELLLTTPSCPQNLPSGWAWLMRCVASS